MNCCVHCVFYIFNLPIASFAELRYFYNCTEDIPCMNIYGTLTYTDQYNKSTPKLLHSASLEQFPGPTSRLKPSYSLGNMASYKQRFHESFTAPGFSSVESLLEEPEIMDIGRETATQDSGNVLFNFN